MHKAFWLFGQSTEVHMVTPVLTTYHGSAKP